MSQQNSWAATVGTAIALQWAVVLVCAAVTGLASGESAARSLVCGGTAVIVPNSILALWLTLRMRRSGSAGAGAMMVGEILKLGFTIAALVWIVGRIAGLVWPAMLLGVLGAVLGQWLALWVTRRF